MSVTVLKEMMVRLCNSLRLNACRNVYFGDCKDVAPILIGYPYLRNYMVSREAG